MYRGLMTAAAKRCQPQECGSLSVDHSGKVSSEKVLRLGPVNPNVKSGIGKPRSRVASKPPGWAARRRGP